MGHFSAGMTRHLSRLLPWYVGDVTMSECSLVQKAALWSGGKMLPGALPFTSSTLLQPALKQIITSRQVGTFPVRQSLPGKVHWV